MPSPVSAPVPSVSFRINPMVVASHQPREREGLETGMDARAGRSNHERKNRETPPPSPFLFLPSRSAPLEAQYVMIGLAGMGRVRNPEAIPQAGSRQNASPSQRPRPPSRLPLSISPSPLRQTRKAAGRLLLLLLCSFSSSSSRFVLEMSHQQKLNVFLMDRDHKNSRLLHTVSQRGGEWRTTNQYGGASELYFPEHILLRLS